MKPCRAIDLVVVPLTDHHHLQMALQCCPQHPLSHSGSAQCSTSLLSHANGILHVSSLRRLKYKEILLKRFELKCLQKCNLQRGFSSPLGDILMGLLALALYSIFGLTNQLFSEEFQTQVLFFFLNGTGISKHIITQKQQRTKG